MSQGRLTETTNEAEQIHTHYHENSMCVSYWQWAKWNCACIKRTAFLMIILCKYLRQCFEILAGFFFSVILCALWCFHLPHQLRHSTFICLGKRDRAEGREQWSRLLIFEFQKCRPGIREKTGNNSLEISVEVGHSRVHLGHSGMTVHQACWERNFLFFSRCSR